jgi:hypothetical protein
MARSPAPFALGLVTWLAVGCDATIEPIAVAPGCPTRPLREPPKFDDEPGDRLVSNFENGSKELALVNGRDGSWILGADLTGGSWTAEASDKCVANGEYSGHFSGSGYSNWGINWTAVFRKAVYDPTVAYSYAAVPYDGRAYQGISFFAALGGESGPDHPIPMGITTMDNAYNGKICKGACMDYYRKDVTLTRAWKRYDLRFADLAQGNFGVPHVPTMRRDQLVGFIIYPEQQFDIWIDDVRLEP